MATLLTCPKCQGEMRNYERNGIHIDQCSECRGVFLDRGELEHLITAEAAYSQPVPAAVPTPARQEYREQDYRSKDSDYDRGNSHQKRKKSSFLSELFD